MAFIFSTSHLPETRVRRPDHLEDEEEEPSAARQTAAGSPKGERSESTRMQQPMPRAGGVRAFSHLPVRDNPAPSTGPLREDSPRGEIGPIPPRSATPSTSGSPMSEPQDDAPPPEADSDPEDDTAPQDHADDRPWYMPRITAQDLPPQDHPEDAHAPSPKPWENTSPNSRFDAAPHADRSTSSNGFSPSPQNLRDDFHATTPDSPTREAPAQDSRPALTRGRIFEQRSAPAAFLMQQQSKGASGSTSRQRLQVSQQALAAQPQPVRGTTPPANGNTPAAQPQALAQAQRPAANPAQNAPAAPQPPTGGPAVKQAQTPQFQVDEADENTQFDLTDQDTGKLLQTGVKFGDHARSVINEEIENSPVAIAALNRARELSKKNVVVHLTNDEQATPRIGLDGTIHIYVNPKTLKPGTLAHEISHVLQGWHRTMAMRSGKPLTGADMKAVNAQGKAELETLARGVTDAKGDANEERENEAMRVANIVKAEVSAAKVKRQLETLKNSNNKADKDEYNRLIQNPAEIARMFWNEMRPPDKRIPPREGTKHQTNTYRMPESSIYGGYDFTHVLKTLGNGVTHEILMHQTPVRDEYQPGPNQKLR